MNRGGTGQFDPAANWRATDERAKKSSLCPLSLPLFLFPLCSLALCIQLACVFSQPRSDAASPQKPLLKKRTVLRGHHGRVTALVFTPDGENVIAGSGYRSSLYPRGDLVMWNVKTGRRVHYRKHWGRYDALAISPDGKRLVAMDKYYLDVWDIRSFKRLRKIDRGGHGWRMMSLSPDGKAAALIKRSSGRPGIEIIDLETGKRTRTLGGYYSAIAFSPDGKTLAAGESIQFAGDDVLRGEGTVHLWDTSSWKRRVWTDPEKAKSCRERSSMEVLVYSPDGKRLLTSVGWRTRIWNVEKERVESSPAAYARAATFSPDTRVLATVYDKLCIWDTRTARRLARVTAHQSGIYSVAFSPDGKLLATGGDADKAVILWDIRLPVMQPATAPSG